MKCGEIRDIIVTDYVDNELDANARQAIDAHVKDCAACRRFMQAVMRTSVAPLRSMAPAVPPAFLWQRIAHGLERPAVPAGLLTFFRPAWINALVVASMLACTFFAGNYLAHDIWSSRAQSTESFEVADTLGLQTLSDMPAGQVETAYTTIVGG